MDAGHDSLLYSGELGPGADMPKRGGVGGGGGGGGVWGGGVVFFFNDTATTEIYTLSLHDALPILILWQISCTFHI